MFMSDDRGGLVSQPSRRLIPELLKRAQSIGDAYYSLLACQVAAAIVLRVMGRRKSSPRYDLGYSRRSADAWQWTDMID